MSRKPTLKEIRVKKAKLDYKTRCDKIAMGEQYWNGNSYDAPADPLAPIRGKVLTLPREMSYFHIGRQHEKRPGQVIYCKECRSDKFFIGIDNHWTGVKCINCGWEASVHES